MPVDEKLALRLMDGEWNDGEDMGAFILTTRAVEGFILSVLHVVRGAGVCRELPLVAR